jgi:hypothetical protein
MLARTYLRLSDDRILALTGCRTSNAVRGWVDRWNAGHPKEPIHRIHGKVDLLTLERAVLWSEAEHRQGCRGNQGGGVSFRRCV